MKTYLSTLFVFAYFAVFLAGLMACFQVTHQYYQQHQLFRASSTFTLALCAIAGLIQAIIGV